MIAEDDSINIPLTFSLARYDEVIDAYLAGLGPSPREASTWRRCTAWGRFSCTGSTPKSTARLDAIGTSDALALKGQAAVAQAKLRLPAVP